MDSDIGNVPAVLLVSSSGVICKIPTCQFNRLIQRGQRSLTLEFELDQNTVAPSATDAKDWLTIQQAVGMLIEDIDGLEDKPARDRILRAIDLKAFNAVGFGRNRRIEPATFALWVSKQRKKAAERIDNDEQDERILRKRRELGLE
jgi:hypothetical protein